LNCELITTLHPEPGSAQIGGGEDQPDADRKSNRDVDMLELARSAALNAILLKSGV
jgi:hypothetical protein